MNWQANGKGKIYLKDGCSIDGEFKNGSIDNGKKIYTDGSVYSGYFK